MKHGRPFRKRSSEPRARCRAAPEGPGGQPDFFSAQVSEARRFYLDLEPPSSERLAVVSGGCERCAPDYRIRRSSFPYLSVEFVAQGEGALRLGGLAHRLVPGVAFAYGPGVPHDIQNDPDRPLLKYFVDFTGAAARGLLRPPCLEPGQVVQTAAPEEVLKLFEELVRAGLRNTPFTPRICALLVEQIVLKIAETAAPPGSAGTLAFETYQRCRDMIERCYLELETLGQIAARCRVDPAYLCRLFARFDHQSPYRYLTRLKMGHAAARLQSPGVLVKQVADEMGFSDPFHFSRTFARVFGVSPGRFIQMHRRER